MSTDYLAGDFDAVAAANALIRETTTASDASVDISPALRRVGYDLDAVDQEIAALASAHPEELLAHADAMANIQTYTDQMKPGLDNVKAAYGKIVHDFIEPYQTATRTQQAAAKLQQTAALARDLAWYLHLAKQIEVINNKDLSPEELLQAAQSLLQINQLYARNPSLNSLAVVRSHEPSLEPAKSKLEKLATAAVREGGDRGHISSGVYALQTLGLDITSILENILKSLVTTSVLQLSRSSGLTPAAFDEAFADIRARAKTMTIVDSLVPQDFERRFWEQAAHNMVLKLKTMSVASPATIKTMKANQARIYKNTASSPVLDEVFKKYLSA